MVVVVTSGGVVFVVVAGVGAPHLADPGFDCSQPVAVVVAAVLVVRFTHSMIAHVLVCVDVNGVSMSSMAIVIGVLVVVGWDGVEGGRCCFGTRGGCRWFLRGCHTHWVV